VHREGINWQSFAGEVGHGFVPIHLRFAAQL
jgi:hypothetical protein